MCQSRSFSHGGYQCICTQRNAMLCLHRNLMSLFALFIIDNRLINIVYQFGCDIRKLISYMCFMPKIYTYFSWTKIFPTPLLLQYGLWFIKL